MHRRTRVRARAAVLFAAAHLASCLFAIAGLAQPMETGGWGWFLIFVLDAPVSLLLWPLMGSVPPALLLGVLGTVWWGGLAWGAVALIQRVWRRRASFLNPPTR